jgi:dienelactone hydrolase
MDSVERRFRRLSPHIRIYGPPDTLARPAFLIFHGCGGVGANMDSFAQFVSDLGFRAFIIDSYKARGWSRKWGARLACNGLAFRGHERSGDVLASIWGLSQRYDVDPDQIYLGGWSHGAWAVMDLMTQKLTRFGDARLRNPNPIFMKGVRGLFLMYPVVFFPARSVLRDWEFKPRALAVLTLKDHLATYNMSLSMIKRLRAQGVNLDTLTVNSTHAFDEEGIDRFGFMRHDPEAVASTKARLKSFLLEEAVLP